MCAICTLARRSGRAIASRAGVLAGAAPVAPSFAMTCAPVASTRAPGLNRALPASTRAFNTRGFAAEAAPEGADSSEVEMKGITLKGRPLYLDMQATTPIDPRVLDAMMPHFVEQYGNPHSRTHMYGWEAEDSIEEARADVASIIGANPKEIIFTSGATESNNMAIKGVANFYKGQKSHVITT